MKNKLLSIIALVLAFSASQAKAQVPNLQNLNLPQLDSVFKVFGADLAFKPLEPASAYGDYFGFSFGVIGTLASTKKIKSEISGISLNYAPGGDIYLGVQAPFGLALELGFIPALTVKDIRLEKYGGDVKWTVNKVFFDWLPVDVALRGMYTRGQVQYKQTISGIQDMIDYNTAVYGVNASVSKQLLFIEPYLGLGWVRQDATLGNTGRITLFNRTITAQNSFEKKLSSVWYYGGVQFHIFFGNLTAQYDNMFGVHTYSAKVGFKF